MNQVFPRNQQVATGGWVWCWSKKSWLAYSLQRLQMTTVTTGEWETNRWQQVGCFHRAWCGLKSRGLLILSNIYSLFRCPPGESGEISRWQQPIGGLLRRMDVVWSKKSWLAYSLRWFSVSERLSSNPFTAPTQGMIAHWWYYWSTIQLRSSTEQSPCLAVLNFWWAQCSLVKCVVIELAGISLSITTMSQSIFLIVPPPHQLSLRNVQ